MGKTIIQTIGPLYGEVVNGTVFGRPNGSVYVPSANTITITIPTGYDNVRLFEYGFGKRYILSNADGSDSANYKIVAESQDTASYIQTHLEDNSEQAVGSPRSNSAGLFNIQNNIIGAYAEDDPAIVASDTYYLVAVLYSASGVPIATAKQALTGVVNE